ncbi:undecaprenyldiphospho-muramoylpentapeptide beta-N-acetylglucosaminyltransferase [Thalassomonas viridans]|uniref:UDP-N-acetylglucosamine--N-acetylmuramyl-(pentapeptide) pyrophosphoryl-undecaprenol N-acetylglucosamine transferase n=1 Tax=Thalassomonas viridans TaxID=137584 RepID=A0AAE9Z687_9GAMM|nr:undecaprenyldiphospho-muramoylpentapeptide beta-N-acetylglucosaminyltransferase [Thalassomonas viridans]WDE06023.1 undecaprenyldiphospho-muramoylpentapeptide beta-N-acetylglucosaminyltransferase [Thalassomonas viridans]
MTQSVVPPKKANKVNPDAPTLLVMAGGTGGHIFPGIAVAQHLETRGWNIHWLGTAERMEARIVPEHGYPISFINISGLRGKGVKGWLKLPFNLIRSLWQSMAIIHEVKPDVVLGMGGYASGPGGVAAWFMRKPLVLHEQNAVAGMSNRLLAKVATKVLAAFPGAYDAKVNCQVVGNPVRRTIADKDAEPELSETSVSGKKILIVGGSLGAKVLNDVVPAAVSKLEQPVQVWHQSGANNKEAVLSAYQNAGVDAQQIRVGDFIDDMAAAYRWADLVICRAGALTVSELAMAGKAAIFVPLPHAVDDHQTKNAMYLVARGAAKLLPQKEFNATALAEMLSGLFTDDREIEAMAEAAIAAAHSDATDTVSNICQGLLAQ